MQEEKFKNEADEINITITMNKSTIIWCAIVVSLLFNVYLGIALYKTRTDGTENNLAKAQNIPSAPDPQQPATAVPSPTTLQNFEITKNDHIRGDFNAPITLVEFSDFECPFCERHYPTLTQTLDKYKGQVRLVYKHFPLGFHPNAQKAAESSECADEQGKFWEYHDKLFKNQPSGYSLEKFKQWAKDMALNTDKFNTCLDSGKYAQKVQSDLQEGQTKGVQGTPATFVNGQLVSGAIPYESFQQIIAGLLSQ